MISLPFLDTFDADSVNSGSVYTKLIAGTYTVSGGKVKVADHTTTVDDVPGFYTTDYLQGDFAIEWETNLQIVSSGTGHQIGIRIDANNYIHFTRYWSSTWGWNWNVTKWVNGVSSTVFADATSHGQGGTTAYDLKFKITKVGQVFSFYIAFDNVNYTLRWSGTISDFASNAQWHITQFANNNKNTSTFYLYTLRAYSLAPVLTNASFLCAMV